MAALIGVSSTSQNKLLSRRVGGKCAEVNRRSTVEYFVSV